MKVATAMKESSKSPVVVGDHVNDETICIFDNSLRFTADRGHRNWLDGVNKAAHLQSSPMTMGLEVNDTILDICNTLGTPKQQNAWLVPD